MFAILLIFSRNHTKITHILQHFKKYTQELNVKQSIRITQREHKIRK